MVEKEGVAPAGRAVALHPFLYAPTDERNAHAAATLPTYLPTYQFELFMSSAPGAKFGNAHNKVKLSCCVSDLPFSLTLSCFFCGRVAVSVSQVAVAAVYTALRGNKIGVEAVYSSAEQVSCFCMELEKHGTSCTWVI